LTRSIVIRAPKIVIDELDNIKAEEELQSNQEAFNKMVKYSQVGREARRIARLDFRWRPRK
jgi:hypothetical protein